MELYLKDNYKIELLAESVTAKESLDAIAYTLTVELAYTDELRALGIAKGDSIMLYDNAYSLYGYEMIFNGVVWDLEKDEKDKKVTITGRERTVHIEESEDEYLWSEGQTALDRMMIIANDWGIPVGYTDDPKIGLSKSKRKESLYSMMKKDLKETAQKGGSLYRIRMDEKLDFIELGTNVETYELSGIIDSLEYKESMDGIVTQVKVLGKNDKDDKLSPIIGTFSQDTETYGCIQKIIQDDDVKSYSDAENKSISMFNTGEDSISVNCVKDINYLRAGNQVSLYNNPYIITEMTHKFGNCNTEDPGSMNVILMTWEGVRKKYYAE
ncbi:XkdQ [uncultured Clostridium sp.]|uniref:XkdQ/YqbQ family protein n=1 Tax=uncultured Clostridium sp. TaxID=59620 RepID=UPI0028E8EC9A|nr:XkdQ [uncultured Clostridium sp.]